MPRSSIGLSDELSSYIADHGERPDAIQAALIEETSHLGRAARMQVAPAQGAFMALLARTIGARRAIEIGTFTGYSALCVARALPTDGTLICCDTSEEWTNIARRYWQDAGVSDRIELRLGPALDTLQALRGSPPFDMAFIDADKTGYLAYYEELLRLVRPGGLILADNVLWSGRVLDPTEEDAVAIDRFNKAVQADPRVNAVMLPVGDGLTIMRVE